MSVEGQGHFFTIYFPGFVCFVLYKAKISGERLQDHWSSGFWIVLMALSLLYTYICYYPIATFQKAGTCLDAQQSMAKQPIKTLCE